MADLQKDKEKCEAGRFANMDQFLAGNLDKVIYQKRRTELTKEAERLDVKITELEAKLQETELVQDEETRAALETADAGTVGSAMLTGISAGCFRDLEDAACHMVRQGTVYQPDRDRHDRYMKYYRQYRSLYQAVRPLVQ